METLQIHKVKNGVLVLANTNNPHSEVNMGEATVFTSYYDLKVHIENTLGPMYRKSQGETLVDKMDKMSKAMDELKVEIGDDVV